MAALIDATTGYPGDTADWTDASPQPDSADSGASLENPSTYASFIWPVFTLVPAETGYDTVADWFDSSPQPDSASSGAALAFNHESGYGIIDGRWIDPGTGIGSRETWGIIGE